MFKNNKFRKNQKIYLKEIKHFLEVESSLDAYNIANIMYLMLKKRYEFFKLETNNPATGSKILIIESLSKALSLFEEAFTISSGENLFSDTIDLDSILEGDLELKEKVAFMKAFTYVGEHFLEWII